MQPGGSEETLLDRLFSYYGSVQGESKGGALARPGGHAHARLTSLSACFQEATCSCGGRSPTSSCWATATGRTGSSTMPRAGWATPATTLPPRTLPRCCRTPRSRNPGRDAAGAGAGAGPSNRHLLPPLQEEHQRAVPRPGQRHHRAVGLRGRAGGRLPAGPAARHQHEEDLHHGRGRRQEEEPVHPGQAASGE